MNRYYIHRGNEIEITPRELLFCVALFFVLMFLGYPIASAIKRHENDKNLIYNQAVQITDQSQFEQAFETDIGYAFVDGMFTCEGVSYERLSERYLKIIVEHEEYTKHTRVETYTTTDSKGRTKTHMRTVHYWTWDNVGGFKDCCHTVLFKGMSFAYDNFDYSEVPSTITYIDTGYHKRDVVTTYPRSFYCTVFCNMRRKSFFDKARIYYDNTIEQAHMRATKTCGVAVFWSLWTLFVIFICGVVIAQENNWLEDK